MWVIAEALSRIIASTAPVLNAQQRAASSRDSRRFAAAAASDVVAPLRCTPLPPVQLDHGRTQHRLSFSLPRRVLDVLTERTDIELRLTGRRATEPIASCVWPPSLRVSVNGYPMSLMLACGSLDHKAPRYTPRPVNLLAALTSGRNTIDMATKACACGHVFQLLLVQRISPRELRLAVLHRADSGAYAYPPGQPDLSTGEAALCPLSKRQMELPCRGRACKHSRCFDFETYVASNRQSQRWTCPVCSCAIWPEDIVHDAAQYSALKSRRPAEAGLTLHGSARPQGSSRGNSGTVQPLQLPKPPPLPGFELAVPGASSASGSGARRTTSAPRGDPLCLPAARRTNRRVSDTQYFAAAQVQQGSAAASSSSSSGGAGGFPLSPSPSTAGAGAQSVSPRSNSDVESSEVFSDDQSTRGSDYRHAMHQQPSHPYRVATAVHAGGDGASWAFAPPPLNIAANAFSSSRPSGKRRACSADYGQPHRGGALYAADSSAYLPPLKQNSRPSSATRRGNSTKQPLPASGSISERLGPCGDLDDVLPLPSARRTAAASRGRRHTVSSAEDLSKPRFSAGHARHASPDVAPASHAPGTLLFGSNSGGGGGGGSGGGGSDGRDDSHGRSGNSKSRASETTATDGVGSMGRHGGDASRSRSRTMGGQVAAMRSDAVLQCTQRAAVAAATHVVAASPKFKDATAVAALATAEAAVAAASAATKAILDDLTSDGSASASDHDNGSASLHDRESLLWTVLEDDAELINEKMIIADIQAGLRAGADGHQTLAGHQQGHEHDTAPFRDDTQHLGGGLHIAPFEGLDDPLSEMFPTCDRAANSAARFVLGEAEDQGHRSDEEARDAEMNELVTELLSGKDDIDPTALDWNINEGGRRGWGSK